MDTEQAALGPVVWNLSEAVRRTGVSRSTLQRRLKAGAIPGAERNLEGEWAIPVAGLIAAGVSPDMSEQVPDTAAADTAAEMAELRETVTEQRFQLERALRIAAERELARVEDALADARKRADEMAAVVRMLTAGPVSDPVPAMSDDTRETRRRWWNR